MATDPIVGLPISLSGSDPGGSLETTRSPELEAADQALTDSLAAFTSAAAAFLAAGGDPVELMRRFQGAVMG